MKINNWNTLKEQGFIKKGDKYIKGGNVYYKYEHCKKCGEQFLGKKDSIYCSKECSDKKEYSEEIRKKMSENNSGENNPFYDNKHSDKTKNNISNTKLKQTGGYYSKGIPAYDTYAPQLEWAEEVRRSQIDENILEVMCFKCGEWFIPKLWVTRNRAQFLKDKTNIENRFYCSQECKDSCSVYHKSAENIMREDAIRAGRLPWLELKREVQPELRKMVIERDGYICQRCGATKNLQCHHIYPVAINPLESADIDNCIMLCEDCHLKAHEKEGCRYKDLIGNIC